MFPIPITFSEKSHQMLFECCGRRPTQVVIDTFRTRCTLHAYTRMHLPIFKRCKNKQLPIHNIESYFYNMKKYRNEKNMKKKMAKMRTKGSGLPIPTATS